MGSEKRSTLGIAFGRLAVIPLLAALFLPQIAFGKGGNSAILELHGYFRFRGEIFQNMAMDVGPGVKAPEDLPLFMRRGYGWFPFYYPISSYPGLNKDDYRSELKNARKDPNDYPRTLTSANMRLRLLMKLNVAERIQIRSTLDILDNAVLGSTPMGYGGLDSTLFAPTNLFSEAIVPPTFGENGFLDSIRVRHLYASIRLPFGILRVGRMPAYRWGLGIVSNPGMELDSDYGDTVDRVIFITKIFGYIIRPAFDIISSGPISRNTGFGNYLGQPFDLEPGDDIRQVSLSVGKIDRGKKLRDKMEDGALIINYGLYLSYRWQDLTAECFPTGQNTPLCSNRDLNPQSAVNNRGRVPSQIALTKRGASLFQPDIWFRLLWGEKLRLELEFTIVYGSIERDLDGQMKEIFQWGGALEFDVNFMEETLVLSFGTGIASGDADFFSRWGSSGDTDKKINNFVFDPDYYVDLLLWREMYGAVTNGWYMKAHLTYNFQGNPWREDGIGVRAGAVFSMALNPEATLGKSSPLGVELNANLRWGSSDGYFFSFDYGILFPLPGLAYAKIQNGQRQEIFAGSIAQRFRFRLMIFF